jgi:hypothetical protein
MLELLIDDSGEAWPVQPETISRRFGLERPRDFVLRTVDLGFIFIRFCEFGARVALRPQFASRSALSRLSCLIRQRNPARVAIARDARRSSWEIAVGADQAIARIEELVAEARRPSPRPLLTFKRLPVERCRDIAGGQLLPVLQAWEQTQSRWEPDFYGRLLEGKLLPVTMISEQPAKSERLLIRHWGARHTSFGKDWIAIAPGRDVEDLPNAEIGQWRAAKTRATIAEGVPRLTASDLVFRRIDGALARLQYCRLSLPWRTSDGALLVTGTRVARRMLILERPNPAN